MKRLSTFTVLAMVLVMACKREKPEPAPNNPSPSPSPTKGTVVINVVPQLNGIPFDFYTDYINPYNQRIQIEVLRFFLTDFYAHTASGDSTMILDAFKFAWGPPHQTSVSFEANPGTYTSMSIGIGVNNIVNHQDPTLFDPKHPLSYNLANTMHWGWAAGYIFMKMEGKSDQSGTGSGPLNHLFAFHTGNDQCYVRTPLLGKNFTITAGETITLNLNVDIAGFFTQPTDTIDLSVDSVTHATSVPDIALAKRIAKNVSQSFWFD